MFNLLNISRSIIQSKKYKYVLIVNILVLFVLAASIFIQSYNSSSTVISLNYSLSNSKGSESEQNLSNIPTTTDVSEPTGNILFPTEGSNVYGPEITLEAEASDVGTGVNRVEFYAKSIDSWSNDQWIHMGTDTISPYEYTWDVIDLGDQSEVILALQVFDNSGNTSGYINETSFTIKNTVPNNPTLNAPTTGYDFISGEPVVFSWNTSEGAQQYFLEITGGSLPYSHLTPGWISGTSHTYTNMLDMSSQPYYWRVKTRNYFGESSWSESRSLTISERIPQPAAPALTLPSDSSSFIQGAAITFSWNPSDFATEHLLEIKSGETSETIFNTGWTSNTSYIFSELLAPSILPYQWSVKSRNAAGESIAQSRTFFVNPIPTGCAVPSHTGVLLYTETNCSGSRYIANAKEFTKLSSPFNNATKSIYIKEGWSIKIFENKDRTGGRLCITSSQNTLKGLKYNNGSKVVLNEVSTISAFKAYQSSDCK